MNFKRVLCPVALSPASREPLRYAAALASAYSAQLFVCHCAGARSNSAQEIESLKEQVTYLLRDNLQAGPEINGCLNWEALIVAGHNPGAAIVAEAARQ